MSIKPVFCMYKKISLLFFLFISHLFFAQTDTHQVKEIKDILAKSGEYLNNLECDKSMLLAKETCIQSCTVLRASSARSINSKALVAGD